MYFLQGNLLENGRDQLKILISFGVGDLSLEKAVKGKWQKQKY